MASSPPLNRSQKYLSKFLYNLQMKPIAFLGHSLDDLREFPSSARSEAGYQLDRVQHGLEPEDFKPMASIGKGVWEIRISDEAGQFRVIYIAKLKDAVFVLHCFQKKSQKTPLKDLDLASKRLRELLQGHPS
jgi:phage-related protein